MDSDTTLKPKKGRPPIYPIEERKASYQHKNKLAQTAHYALHKEEKALKTKHQAKLYRFAYQILKDVWKEHLLKDTRFHTSIQALFEEKQVVEY